MFIGSSAKSRLNLRQLSLQHGQFVSSILGGHVRQDNVERGAVDTLRGHGADEDTEQTTEHTGDTMQIVDTTAVVQVESVIQKRLDNL